VAQNAIADYWRAFYRLPVVGVDHVAPGWEPADAGARREPARDDRAARRVEALLGNLPDRYRRVLELRFIQRMTVAETAHAMGITSGNAKVLQYRALRKAALLEVPDA
jgi:RNA polymerase sigma factor (sigma-70 family)